MKPVFAALIAIAAMTAPLAAQADNDKGKGNGKQAGGPPGLANKPYGMPPGQAKKMYNRGQRLPANYLTSQYYVTQPVTYLAPPPAGSRWVRVDNQYYLVQTRTGLIAQTVAALLR